MYHKRFYPPMIGLLLVLFILGACRAFGVQEDALTQAPPTEAAASPTGPADTPPATLEAVAWQLISYADSKGNQVGVLAGSDITLTFQDNHINGSAGCNSYFAIYQKTADNLTIKSAGVTEMFCMAPQGIMEQEAGYLAALQSVASFRLGDDRLHLLDDRGSTILIFREP